MQTRIYLIGFMGSGKTTSGKKIARMMAYNFLDLDHWIEEQEGMKIPEIFEKHGEAYFRNKETEAIKALANIERTIISTGGGAPCHNNNMELLNSLGLTVYLQMSAGALLNRLKNSHTDRPLLTGKTEEEMFATINEMLEQREVFYTKAQMTVDGMGKVDERVVNAIQRR